MSFGECDLCGGCERKCPYHLSIRDMIVKNIKLYERISKPDEKLSEDVKESN